MDDTRDPNRSADLAAFSVMRAMLRTNATDATDAVRADVERILDDTGTDATSAETSRAR